jgi:hypothetical protein
MRAQISSFSEKVLRVLMNTLFNWSMRSKKVTIDRETAIQLTAFYFMGYPIEIELPIEEDNDLDWDDSESDD